MKSPGLPNPNILPRLLFAACLPILAMAGCGQGSRIEIYAEHPANKEFLVGNTLARKNNLDIEREADLVREADEGTTTDRSIHQPFELQFPAAKPKSTNHDRRPPILAVQLNDSVAMGVPIGLFSNQTLLMRNDGSIQRIQKSAYDPKTTATKGNSISRVAIWWVSQ